jgi:16S rRNA processing protein RimM
MSENWKQVGKIKEPHGLKGELYVLIFSGDTSWVKELKVFKLNDQVYSVERVKPFRDGLLLKPKEIVDRNQSEAVHGFDFLIPGELLVSKKGDTIFLSEILGFEVFNQDSLVGPIIKFSSNGPQDLLVVAFQGRQVDIPFVHAFIRDIDFPLRRVMMELPEGLLELGSED